MRMAGGSWTELLDVPPPHRGTEYEGTPILENLVVKRPIAYQAQSRRDVRLLRL